MPTINPIRFNNSNSSNQKQISKSDINFGAIKTTNEILLSILHPHASELYPFNIRAYFFARCDFNNISEFDNQKKEFWQFFKKHVKENEGVFLFPDDIQQLDREWEIAENKTEQINYLKEKNDYDTFFQKFAENHKGVFDKLKELITNANIISEEKMQEAIQQINQIKVDLFK